ncbi:hypothetical protein XF24_00295 [candidate division SR1 bacterium Aalborg_AAW-1]|nr:hypothetical protein XF24_00295 [candidate division SR1 bacterium Aalborg_AAW-1]
MNTLNTVSESSNTVTVLMDKLNQACADLVDALVMVFDKISEYGVKTVQGVMSGAKSLFADVIVIKLNQISALIKELKKESHEDAARLIQFQKNEILNRFSTHAFFRENFARRVNEIFN